MSTPHTSQAESSRGRRPASRPKPANSAHRCAAGWPNLLAGKLLGLLLCAVASQTASAQQDVWATLKQPGHILLMRHANAPGIGIEPPDTNLKDCSVQRNLDEAGRAQARQVGANFRKAGHKQLRVVSSLYCRALETGRLMGLGPVEPQPFLNYIDFDNRVQLETLTNRTLAFIKKIPARQLAILVTHVSNVKALADVTPASAEIVIVRFNDAGALTVAGRIPPR